MGYAEFISDRSSRAWDMTAYALKIRPVNQDQPRGPFELVKYHNAQGLSYYKAIEPGYIDGLPGVRVLRLWTATADDADGRITVEEAIRRPAAEGRPSHLLLASAKFNGGLAVTACIGYDWDRPGIQVPTSRIAEADLPVVEVALDDRLVEPLPRLVEYHMDRMHVDGFDPYSESGSKHIDVPLAWLLQVLPESDI